MRIYDSRPQWEALQTRYVRSLQRQQLLGECSSGTGTKDPGKALLRCNRKSSFLMNNWSRMATATCYFINVVGRLSLKMIIPDNRKQDFMGKLRGFKEIRGWVVTKCQHLWDLQEPDLLETAAALGGWSGLTDRNSYMVEHLPYSWYCAQSSTSYASFSPSFMVVGNCSSGSLYNLVKITQIVYVRTITDQDHAFSFPCSTVPLLLQPHEILWSTNKVMVLKDLHWS